MKIINGIYEVLDCSGDVELDLGCGKGGFLLSLAERYPQRQILGADIMLGRLRRLGRKVERLGLSNVQLLRAAAWELVAVQLPDACLIRAHVLCPDPWPKARHRANRLLGSEFLGRLHRKIRRGGVLHLSTDNPAYLEVMRQAITPLACYRACASGIEDICDLKTDFERDFENQGVSVQHLVYEAV